jgi:hypothetical protein
MSQIGPLQASGVYPLQITMPKGSTTNDILILGAGDTGMAATMGLAGR